MDKPLSQERLRIRITRHEGINWYGDDDIGKELDVVEVMEHTYRVDTDEPYELGVSKSHCEIVSGSVSQERRKLIAIPEERYKRLQAIEIEHKRFERALQTITSISYDNLSYDHEDAICMVNIAKNALINDLEGADTNETH